MRLIKKVEVNYLRSLYGAVLDDVGSLNVVFGRNDSGKSNLLRALNLFFNEMIEPDRWLDFQIDMSDRRRQQARDAKGKQFIWIKITFNVPENYRSSLGDEIAVKRQWNRDGDRNQTVFPALETSGKQARLTRFLNDIDFAYIPAVKDLEVYEDLIERMYGAASETEALTVAATNFVEAIADQTTTLSDQLSALFGGPAKLAAPTEMNKLFRNLDFSHGSDSHSLLRQKGDGVKARHLPELLRFINENEKRKKFFVWGFEEPENSLDLGAADSEARRFADFSTRDDTQVFITSHSPAFYLAGADTDAEVRRYFISKQVLGDQGAMEPSNAATKIDDLDDAEASMEAAGLLQLPYVIRQLSVQREELDRMEEEAASLRSEIRRLNRPTLFVEGEHDETLFSSALARRGVLEQIQVKNLGGAPQTSDALFAAVLEQGGLDARQRTLFLFDDDKAGRGASRKLGRTNFAGPPSAFKENTSVWLLPRTDEFDRFARRVGIARDQMFFTAEFLFPAEAAAELCLELTAQNDEPDIVEWRSAINGDYWPGLGQPKCVSLINADPGTVEWFYGRGVPNRVKRSFAEQAVARAFDLGLVDQIAETIEQTLLH